MDRLIINYEQTGIVRVRYKDRYEQNDFDWMVDFLMNIKLSKCEFW